MRHTVFLVAFLAAMFQVTAASGQGTNRPFALPTFRTGETAPDLRKIVPAWVAAIERHRPGEFDAAVQAVSGLSGGQLAGLVDALEGNKLQVDPLRVVTRAILLHTDVAAFAISSPHSADRVWWGGFPSLHLGVAYELISWRRRRAGSADSFTRDWHEAVAALLLSAYDITSAPLFMNGATSVFPRDANLLLMAGGVHELLASPRIQHGGDLRYVDKRGSARDHLSGAERLYREALRADPSSSEARVRLGRVLGQQGQHERALEELTRASTEQPPPALIYFIHLFIGEEEEALDRPERARAAFERAVELRPGVSFAYLALSRLERRAGGGSASLSALERMLAVPEGERDESDLWGEYYASGLARIPQVALDKFREAFGSRR